MAVVDEVSQLVDGAAQSVGSIVVVEDPLVSKLVRAVLEKRGYEVKLAGAADAAALLASPQSRVGILVTNTPDTFLQFADRVPLLYLTSAPNLLLEAAFRTCRVVVKPFVPSDLVTAVTELSIPL
ncbi:MAG TPA: hypothetical protein VGF16_01880 [Bryobacteraceae bacterium]|jgi:DNA-binding response OmpR family regulator